MLAGLRVLDASQLLPGPFCAQILADLGADVIRVEPPYGDMTRTAPNGIYEIANRNKRSLVLNLREAEHRRAFHAVAATVDVVIEGFRPGVAERLEIDFERLRQGNPGLVYCSISGFGQDGPRRMEPGHDLIYMAAAGALEYSGHWLEDAHHAGLPFSDLATAAYGAVAILAALFRRSAGGAGSYIDLAITDVAMALTSVRAGAHFDFAGADRLHLYPTNELFVASDGVTLAIAAVEQHFWEGMRSVIAQRDDRINEPAYDDSTGRWSNGDRLVRLLKDVIAQEPSDTWLTELRAADVPVTPVLSASEAVDAARSRERDVVVEVGDQRHVPFPAFRDGQPMAHVNSLAPALGAHTEEILREVGWTSQEIAEVLGDAVGQ
jgi:crotonobetainyl-CoA:carnitine CoA-transferase CaiB-like acyl-CoA transferase